MKTTTYIADLWIKLDYANKAANPYLLQVANYL